MGRVLIIGAGGVGTVVAHKVAQNADIFTDIMIASRTKEKCDKIVEAIGNPNIKTAKVDADNVDETGRYQFTYDQAPATEHTLYARLSPSFSDPQYPWKTDSIVVNFGEIELIDGEGMLIGRGSKEVNFQLVHSSPQK